MRIITLISILCFSGSVSAQWVGQYAAFKNKTLGFYEFSIVDENVVWAICYDGIGGLFGPNHVLDFTRTSDGGNNWIAGTMGNDTSLAFSNICALSDKEAWVAMHKFDNSRGGGIFHTTDGGATWEQSNKGVLFDDRSFPNFVYFKDKKHGVAAGDATNGYFEIYTTSNGGKNWIRTPKSNVPDYVANGGSGWFDGFSVQGDTIWFGTEKGQMYKSVDFGKTWTVHSVNTLGYTVNEIAFNDDKMHGLCHVRVDSTTMLYGTSDGGATWKELRVHPQWKQSRITSIPGTNRFVSTSVIHANRGSAYSDDFGHTWIEIDSEAHKAACRFLNRTTGWSGGYFNDNPKYPFRGGIYKWDESKK